MAFTGSDILRHVVYAMMHAEGQEKRNKESHGVSVMSGARRRLR